MLEGDRLLFFAEVSCRPLPRGDENEPIDASSSILDRCCIDSGDCCYSGDAVLTISVGPT